MTMNLLFNRGQEDGLREPAPARPHPEQVLPDPPCADVGGRDATAPVPPRARAKAWCGRLAAVLTMALGAGPLVTAAEPPAYRAARSVHLAYSAPEVEAFHLAVVVDRSTPGSYFMACGWNTGYFGIQELANGRKVAIFSVWDPTRGDDPNAVAAEDRVEVLHQGEGVRIKRFGGEGTGGQCMTDWDWQLGQTNRFLVTATVHSNKTAYAGYLWDPKARSWKHLVTFQTRTGGKLMSGLYSFIEDFRRDGRSAQEERRARFFQGWVRTAAGNWQPLARARFTASAAEWEARDNIDGGAEGDRFYLATGGATRMSRELRSMIEIAPADGLPPRELPGALTGDRHGGQ